MRKDDTSNAAGSSRKTQSTSKNHLRKDRAGMGQEFQSISESRKLTRLDLIPPRHNLTHAHRHTYSTHRIYPHSLQRTVASLRISIGFMEGILFDNANVWRLHECIFLPKNTLNYIIGFST